MKRSPRRVLVSIHSRTHLRILETLIGNLSTVPEVEIGIVLVREELIDAESRLSRLGKIYRLYPTPILFRVFNKIPWPGFLRDFFVTFSMYRRGKKHARRIVNEFKPDFIFLSADRYFDFDLPLLNLHNRDFKIAVLGIDHLYVENYETYAFNTKPLLKESAWIRWVIQTYFVDQIYEAFGKSFTFFPFGRILALKLLGALYPKAHLIGANRDVDFIFVDGERTREVYLREGIESSRIYSNSLLEHDEVFCALQVRKQIRNDLLDGVNPQTPVVILGVPQLLEHNLLDAESHWQEIEYLFSVLSKSKAKVLLSLHPKQQFESYAPLAKKYGLVILKQPLKEVIAVADVYVATFSSTVLLGALLGIPTVVLDLYGFKYSYFKNILGVEVVNTRSQFESALTKALILGVNPERGKVSGFGVLDGKAWNRVALATRFLFE